MWLVIQVNYTSSVVIWATVLMAAHGYLPVVSRMSFIRHQISHNSQWRNQMYPRMGVFHKHGRFEDERVTQ